MVNIERNVVDVSSRLIIALLEKSYRNYNKAKKIHRQRLEKPAVIPSYSEVSFEFH